MSIRATIFRADAALDAVPWQRGFFGPDDESLEQLARGTVTVAGVGARI
jgi:hypothetical protein